MVSIIIMIMTATSKALFISDSHDDDGLTNYENNNNNNRFNLVNK